MGKIVRSARVAGEKYVVNVPHAGAAAENAVETPELADRFSAPFGIEPEVHGEEVALPPAHPTVDWEQVRAEADAIIDRAASDAEALLRRAEANALDLLARAEAHVAQTESEARARGREEGLIAGEAAVQSEASAMIATLHELIESARAERHTIIESAQPELLRLAMAIAERIVHTEITANPEVVVENVRAALTRLVSREVVTLRVNPADLETIRRHRESLVTSSDVEHLRVVEDQRVDRGGVVVETEAGTIDAKTGTQLREARRVLLNGDQLSAEPSVGEPVRSPAQAG
jgi:flagellar assembly protein FliH